MPESIDEKNKALVLQAFGILFNERDYARAQRFWSPQYIQHSDHIPPGREGLFELVRNAPATMRYENRLTLANGDFLMLHGRFSGLGAGTPMLGKLGGTIPWCPLHPPMVSAPTP